MINIVLDYDGTIHETMSIYAPALRETYKYLFNKGLTETKFLKDADISKWLGFTPKEMWDLSMPYLSEKEKEHCIRLTGNYMAKAMDAGYYKLFDGADRLLSYLGKSSYNTTFLSNCPHSYMDRHIAFFKLDLYYDRFYCSEDFQYREKYEIFNEILKDSDDDLYIIVGDRRKDLEIKKYHDVITVGCLYGYGDKSELYDADFKIKTPLELINVIENIEIEKKSLHR